MYVAVTRAADTLYIMLPLGTIDRRTGMAAAPSRFLAALPPSSGIRAWAGGRETEVNNLLNIEDDMGYNYASSFSSSPAVPRPAPESFAARPVNRPATPREALDPATGLAVGMRVSHPVYGPGLVVEIAGSQAVIDFDLFSRKKVAIQYARLTAL